MSPVLLFFLFFSTHFEFQHITMRIQLWLPLAPNYFEGVDGLENNNGVTYQSTADWSCFFLFLLTKLRGWECLLPLFSSKFPPNCFIKDKVAKISRVHLNVFIPQTKVGMSQNSLPAYLEGPGRILPPSAFYCDWWSPWEHYFSAEDGADISFSF